MTSKRVIQYLLLYSSTSQSFRAFLHDGLATANNRYKMATLCIIEDLTGQWDTVLSDQNAPDADGSKMVDNTMGANAYLKAEVKVMATFIRQCTEIASTR